jgi:hypothetical protein
MPGLVINGVEEEVPTLGFPVFNYIHNPALLLKMGHSMRARHTRRIKSIGLHNTKNIPTVVKPGFGHGTAVGERVVRWWTTNPKPAGAQLIIDWDGHVYCMADLLLHAAYHMGSMNEVSIGIEIYEDDHGAVYEGQLRETVNLVDWLCCRFQIQMQIPTVGFIEEIPRIANGGKDCYGVFGHCHNYHGKQNDPGLDIFRMLRNAGFKEFNFVTKQDLVLWRDIQKQLGVVPDGIPGTETCDALQARGFNDGLYDWVSPVAEPQDT